MKSSVIFYLLKKGAHEEPKRITTGEVAEYDGVSQQTASRKLIQLEREGFISREGGKILVTEKAIGATRKLLREVLDSLDGTTIVFDGRVVAGLGEGAFYMRQKSYINAFYKKLCFKPFPGTLNIHIPEGDIEKRLQLREMKGMAIEGFRGKQRSFGKIDAYRCSFNGIPAAIIFPERSVHGLHVLEVVAPFNLRKKFNLHDGSEVRIEVTKNLPC